MRHLPTLYWFFEDSGRMHRACRSAAADAASLQGFCNYIKLSPETVATQSEELPKNY